MFERAFTEQRLLDAWEQVRESATADGHVSAEIVKFEEEAARQVSELARSLADGSFEPKPVLRVEVPKPSGGTRRLAVPSVRDRVVERALLAELDPVIDPLLLPWSFATGEGSGSGTRSRGWPRRGTRARSGWRGATSMTASTGFRDGESSAD